MNYIPNENLVKKITINTLAQMKKRQEKISMLTCYDASFAQLMNLAGIDVILIGDSLGNVIQGHSTTLPVSLEDMLYHTKNVVRGNSRCFLITDMPFGTYDDEKSAFNNAVKLMQSGCNMIKIEGTNWTKDIVEYLTTRSIPVCSHLGLMPQSINSLGSFRQQATNEEDANKLLADAKLLEKSGSQMLLFEAIPSDLMHKITQDLSVPTIGIGAGKSADGQVLVLNDILGIFTGKAPSFSKNYLDGSRNLTILEAINNYVKEVKEGVFPS